MLRCMLHAKFPQIRTEVAVELVPLREIFSSKIRLRLLLVLAASALLLLTACTSIANLFLARVASRGTELATRIALGAGRARILCQLLTEVTLLAAAGGVLGLVLARVGAGALVAAAPEEVRLLADTRLNAPLFVFATLASLVTALLCGAIPAWQAFRNDPAADLHEGARTSTGGWRAARLRQTLVGVEMALATALLATAALLLHSLVNVMQADRGYQVERVLAADLSLSGARYALPNSRASFYETLVQHVEALPRVVAAGAISDLPAVAASSGASRTIFHATDTDFRDTVLDRPVAMVRSVTPGYLAASGSVLRAGRFFAADEPVLVAAVSESLARRLWPGDSLSAVVGRTLRQGDVSGPLILVTGVLGDVHHEAVVQQVLPDCGRAGLIERDGCEERSIGRQEEVTAGSRIERDQLGCRHAQSHADWREQDDRRCGAKQHARKNEQAHRERPRMELDKIRDAFDEERAIALEERGAEPRHADDGDDRRDAIAHHGAFHGRLRRCVEQGHGQPGNGNHRDHDRGAHAHLIAVDHLTPRDGVGTQTRKHAHQHDNRDAGQEQPGRAARVSKRRPVQHRRRLGRFDLSARKTSLILNVLAEPRSAPGDRHAR